MKEPQEFDALLREWKPPEPGAELDDRVLAAYRSGVRRPAPAWRRFWTMRVSVPAPALIAAALVLVAVLWWLRPHGSQVVPEQAPGMVTRLDASGFQPLPNGAARVVPATEVRK
jgi:hypothetical protein